jgi:flagellar hook-basal body complex protein FliE
MNPAISSLRILPALPEFSPARGGASSLGSSSAGSFSATLQDAIADVDHLQSQAVGEVRGVLEGTGADVHKAVIAVEKADLSFQLMLQVRNKIIAAYQEVERLQF